MGLMLGPIPSELKSKHKCVYCSNTRSKKEENCDGCGALYVEKTKVPLPPEPPKGRKLLTIDEIIDADFTFSRMQQEIFKIELDKVITRQPLNQFGKIINT